MKKKNGVIFRKDYTPDSALYILFFKLVRLWRAPKQRLHIDKEKLKGIEPPYVVLCNHASFYDFYYVKELLGKVNASYVVNNHMGGTPIMAKLRKRGGMIPKKLFYPDKAAIQIFRMLNKGYPVVVFPEGRLSPDGRQNPIVENAAALYKRSKVPLVLVNIQGAYFANPKWRKRFLKSDIYVSVRRVIGTEEMKELSVEELERIIASSISVDEEPVPRNRHEVADRAKGLEGILYRCADCGELYTTVGDGNDLVCKACGARHHLDETYLFSDEVKSISAYYDRIKELEEKELDQVSLRTEVDTRIYTDGVLFPRRERGVCTLTKEGFTYCSDKTSFSIPIEKLRALAFSCNKEFELYYKEELYYFYPVKDRNQTARWALITDLAYEVRNAKREKTV